MQSEEIFPKYILTITPHVENFLEMVAKDYNLPINEMKNRYLYNDEKKFNKTFKKFKSKKPRKVTPYNIFLSDIKTLNDDSQSKNEIWDNIKTDENKILKYNNLSILENKQLLNKNHRNIILSNWINYYI